MITRKLGLNRGKVRLWIEGDTLLAAGFRRGDCWTLSPIAGGLSITADKAGKRKIAGAIHRPIIDINSTETLQPVGHAGDIVFIHVSKGCLTIRGTK